MGLFDAFTSASQNQQQGLPPAHSALGGILQAFRGGGLLGAVSQMADQSTVDKFNNATWDRYRKVLKQMGVADNKLDALEAMPAQARTTMADQMYKEALERQSQAAPRLFDKPGGGYDWVTPGNQIPTGDVPYEKLARPQAPKFTDATIYGPGGATQRVSIPYGQGYTPPPGWSLKAPSEQSQNPKYHIVRDYEGTKAFDVGLDPATGREMWRRPAGTLKPTSQMLTALDESETAHAGLQGILDSGKAILPPKEGAKAFMTPEWLMFRARMGDPNVADFNASKITLIAHLRAVAGAARVNETEIRQVNDAIAGATSYPALEKAIGRASDLLDKSTAILRKNMGMLGSDSDPAALPPGLPDMSGVGVPITDSKGRIVGFRPK